MNAHTRRNLIVPVCLALSCMLVSAGRSAASVLIFETEGGGTLASTALDGSGVNYGNRVTNAVQDGYRYGLSGGETPNVIVNYGTNPTGSSFYGFHEGFGDLEYVVYGKDDVGITDSISELSLIADPGYKVLLFSFDMAGFPFTERTLSSITILDGFDNVLYFDTDVLIQGNLDGTAHTSFTFADPLEANVLKIRINTTITPDTYVAFDNIAFGQVIVPESSSLALSLLGVAILGYLRRRTSVAR